MREHKRGVEFRWLPILAAALVSLALVIPMLAPTPSGAAYPSSFRRHQEQYWVWYAPRSWIASSGKYDLNISSATGTRWNKYGYSAVVCYNPAAWFKYLRNNYRDTAGAGFGLYSKPLSRTHFPRIGRIKQLPKARYGPAYFRQKLLWTGRRKGSGQVIRGEMIMDIFAIDSFGNCAQRFQTRGAPARGNAASIRLLRLVQSTITQRNL